MTIEEAIEGNKALAVDLDGCGQERVAEGVKLGIEALKRIKNARAGSKTIVRLLLPGETDS